MKESEIINYKRYEKVLGLTDGQTILYLEHKFNESLRRGYINGCLSFFPMIIKCRTMSIISKYCI